jgi:hypothetical protein
VPRLVAPLCFSASRGRLRLATPAVVSAAAGPPAAASHLVGCGRRVPRCAARALVYLRARGGAGCVKGAGSSGGKSWPRPRQTCSGGSGGSGGSSSNSMPDVCKHIALQACGPVQPQPHSHQSQPAAAISQTPSQEGQRLQLT